MPRPQVAAAIPALDAAAAIAAEAIAAGHRLAYAGAGSAGPDGARRRAGARRHLRHRRATSTPVLIAGGAATLIDARQRRRGRTATAAARRRAPRPRPGRRRDLRLRQRRARPIPSRSPRPPAPAAPRSSASPTSPARRSSRSPTSPSCCDTGPELIAGSTRMGAGTAQKIALNMISTLMRPPSRPRP